MGIEASAGTAQRQSARTGEITSHGGLYALSYCCCRLASSTRVHISVATDASESRSPNLSTLPFKSRPGLHCMHAHKLTACSAKIGETLDCKLSHR